MHNTSTVTGTATDWSPADNPYAIAVSEAQWWQRTVELGVHRLADADGRISWFSSRQIDARQIVVALTQLLNAEQLEQGALRDLGIDQAVRDALAQARDRFEAALPGIKHMRDALIHFDEWSRGEGRGPQKNRIRAGASPREAAREFWGSGYDPTTRTISHGPYSIDVDAADQAAAELAHAVYLAAHAVDVRTTARLRSTAVDALTAAGITVDGPEAQVRVSPGNDLRIWISISTATPGDGDEPGQLAEQITKSLERAGLRLSSPIQPDQPDAAQRLARGEPVLCDYDT